MVSIIVLLALAGLAIALKIDLAKRRDIPITCLVGGSCNEVLSSRYGSLMGVPNETLGVFYYIGIIAGVLLLPMTGGLRLPLMMIIASTAAAAMSVVLLAIQAFLLRRWCDYCMLSTLINLALMFLISDL